MLVCFMGIDGSGKTSHSLKLTEALRERKVISYFMSPFKLFFYSSIPISRAISTRLFQNRIGFKRDLEKGNNKFFNLLIICFIFLYSWFFKFIMTLRFRRGVVIMDRYFYYLLMTSKIGIKLLKLIPKPDLGFILDIDPSLAFIRMNDIRDKNLPSSYYHELRSQYTLIARVMDFMVLSTEGNFGDVANEILDNVIEKL